MFCSPEDAMDLFLRQCADNGTVLVISIDRGAGGSEPCKIDWISPGRGSLVSIALTSSGLQKMFDLSGAAQFSYEDARAGLVPELVANCWVSFLLVEFPKGRSLLFAQPKMK